MANSTKVAVVGCGYWGKNLIRNFAGLGALGAVCESSSELAAQFSGEYAVPSLSFEGVLESDIGTVAIATPAEKHYELARAALTAGKHVFVEKPLALKAEEAEDLCDCAEKAGLVLMVGHLLRYHPGFLGLQNLILGGVLGELQYIYSNRLSLGKIRREENSLWSFAPHDISMILALVGAEPSSVKATGASYLHEVISDVTTTHLTFPCGVQGHIFVSWLHPFKEQKLVVVGSEGMAVFDDAQPWDSKVLHYAHKIEIEDGIPVPAKAEPSAIALDGAEPLNLECAHFLECVRTGATPLTDGREGLRVLKVLEAAQDALDQDCDI